MEDKLDRYYTNVLSNAEKDKHTTVDSDDKSSGEENLSSIYNVEFEIMQIKGKPLSIYY